MRISKLKSVGHNIADSLASGIGMLIGVYAMNIFNEASSGSEGFIEVDFLSGKVEGSPVSASLSRAINLYKDALPDLCAKHGLEVFEIKALNARFGTDPVYGPHFAVTVECNDGKRSTDQYVGTPGRRLRTVRR